MKSRLLPCAAAGLACTFPVWAGAQVSGGEAGRAYGAFVSGPPAYAGGPRHPLPLDQISAHVRAAALQPLSRPRLRITVYHVRAVNSAHAEMRVAIDARSGRGHDYSEAMPPGRIPDAPARKRESASSPAPAKPVMVDCAAGVATKARPAG